MQEYEIIPQNSSSMKEAVLDKVMDVDVKQCIFYYMAVNGGRTILSTAGFILNQYTHTLLQNTPLLLLVQSKQLHVPRTRLHRYMQRHQV
ncbi:hypothetical protein [Neobacillus mesonae]|uniref:hypothetical protein n=1 Tax=Neobacillus mesonae TaxID=1193713 RepID=UPI00203B8E88|nr:hypothetical protein [Neobacillus mesonae]MCM3570413.1 hypothetical protein [Neobacillus mesonae]